MEIESMRLALNNKNKMLQLLIEALLLFIFFYVIINEIVLPTKDDITLHAQYILSINVGENTYAPNFLYYYIVNLISGFSLDINKILYSSVVVLSLSLVFKYFIVKKYLFNKYSTNTLKMFFYTLSIMFVFCFPDLFYYYISGKMYVGKWWVANLWHNSTIIFLFPFALLLFKYQIESFKDRANIRTTIILVLLVIVNLLIKPSYCLVYFPVTFFYLILIKRKLKDSNKDYILRFIPLFIGGTILLIQKYMIYFIEVGSLFKEKSGINYFEGYKVYRNFIELKYLPLIFINCFLFPILFIFFNKKTLKKDDVSYSIVSLLFGILLSFVLSESGPRMYHGNFFWQNIVTTFILFMVTFKYVLTIRKNKILLAIYFLHVFSGFLYLIHLIVDKNYY